MYTLTHPLYVSTFSLFIYYINKGLKLELTAMTDRFHQEMRRMNRNLVHIWKGMVCQCSAAAAAAVNDMTSPDGNMAPINTTA